MPSGNHSTANIADAWTGGTSETEPARLPSNVDVIVVGAGFSGLQTAYDLHRAGLSCVVLEANARIGGRSYSYPLNSQPGIVELGATWINKDTQPDVYALTQRFGIDVVPQDGKGDVIWEDRKGHVWRAGKDDPVVPPGGNLNDTIALFEAFAKAETIIDVKNPGSTNATEDMSVAEWAQRNNLSAFSQQFIDFGVGALVGRPGREVGLHYFLDYVKSGGGLQHLMGEGPATAQALKLKQGTSAVATGLAGALPAGSVFLNSAVTDIAQSADAGCAATTANGASVQCRKVVLAIPTNTYSHITFSPPLPEDKETITSRTKPGIYIKAMLTYTTPWWQSLGLIGQLYSLEGPLKFSWEASDAEKRHYTLAIFIDSDAAQKFQELSSHEQEQTLLNHLVQLIGSEHKAEIFNVLEMIIKDWTAEPYIGGAPTSSMGPGDYARYSEALRAPFGDLHFGGGELAFEWKGYLEGALRSGSRAAKKVVGACRD